MLSDIHIVQIVPLHSQEMLQDLLCSEALLFRIMWENFIKYADTR